MLHGNSLYAEQPGSLAQRLVETDIRHGDTARVELIGVGVNSQLPDGGPTRLAFCPVTHILVQPRSIIRGTMEEQLLPIPDLVGFSGGARRVIRHLQGKHGFVNIRCTVHSNGRIYLSQFEITDFRPHDGRVNSGSSYADYMRLVSA